MPLGRLDAALLSTLLGLVYPRLTGVLIDDVIAKGQGERLPWLVGLLLLVFLGRDGLNALRILLNNLFEQKVILDLRRDLYAAFQRLSTSWYDHRSSGDLLTRVSEDVMNMERMLIDGIEQGLIALLQLLWGRIHSFSNRSHPCRLVSRSHPLSCGWSALLHPDGSPALPSSA